MEQEKYAEEIEALTLMSDDFARIIFKDNECVEYVINTILGRNDLKIIENKTQYDGKIIKKRSLMFDVYAVDSNGKSYNIEIQKVLSRARERRARYHSSMMDFIISDEGMEFANLSDTYVIFITDGDIFKKGLPLYTVERKILETGDAFNDGTHILYVNSKIENETPLGKLMQDFNTLNPAEMNSSLLSSKVYAYKYGKEKEKMCEIFEKVKEEGKAEGKAEGRVEAKAETSVEIAVNLIKGNRLSDAEISAATSLTEERIKTLREEITKMKN